MEQITNDNEHQITFKYMFGILKEHPCKTRRALCDTMFTLTLKEGRVAEWALNLYTLSKRYNTMNTSHIDSCKP